MSSDSAFGGSDGKGSRLEKRALLNPSQSFFPVSGHSAYPDSTNTQSTNTVSDTSTYTPQLLSFASFASSQGSNGSNPDSDPSSLYTLISHVPTVQVRSSCESIAPVVQSRTQAGSMPRDLEARIIDKWNQGEFSEVTTLRQSAGENTFFSEKAEANFAELLRATLIATSTSISRCNEYFSRLRSNARLRSDQLHRILERASQQKAVKKNMSEVPAVSSDNYFIECNTVQQSKLWEYRVKLSNPSDETAKFQISFPTHVDHLAFFTCMYRQKGVPDKQDPYVSHGEIKPHGKITLIISVVLFSGNEFSRVIPITIEQPSQRTHLMMAVHIKKTDNQQTNESYWVVPPQEAYRKELLGKGSFGTVYKASVRGMVCSMKLWKEDRPDFTTELTVLKEHRHPHLIPFIGAYPPCNPSKLPKNDSFDPDSPDRVRRTTEGFILMCLASDGDLYHYYQNHAFFMNIYVTFLKQIAEGMAYLHEQRCIHRDLKSLNVLVDDGKAYIIDFGLARHEEAVKKSKSYTGTRGWAAPEIMTTPPTYSFATDVFAFGVIMWELSTQRPPDSRNSEQIRKGEVAKMDQAFVENNPKYAALFEECVKFDPSARPSFSEIAKRLTEMEIEYLSSNSNSEVKTWRGTPWTLGPSSSGTTTKSPVSSGPSKHDEQVSSSKSLEHSGAPNQSDSANDTIAAVVPRVHTISEMDPDMYEILNGSPLNVRSNPVWHLVKETFKQKAPLDTIGVDSKVSTLGLDSQLSSQDGHIEPVRLVFLGDRNMTDALTHTLEFSWYYAAGLTAPRQSAAPTHPFLHQDFSTTPLKFPITFDVTPICQDNIDTLLKSIFPNPPTERKYPSPVPLIGVIELSRALQRPELISKLSKDWLARVCNRHLIITVNDTKDAISDHSIATLESQLHQSGKLIAARCLTKSMKQDEHTSVLKATSDTSNGLTYQLLDFFYESGTESKQLIPQPCNVESIKITHDHHS